MARRDLLKVLIQNQQKIRVNLKLIKKQAREILKGLERDDAELSLLLTDDNGIQELNKRYLKKDSPTDVLSFPMYGKDGKWGVGGRRWKKISPHPASHPRYKHSGAGSPHPIILGDVVISIETAKIQAKENGIALYEEIVRLLIHGILHLLGFDHERENKEAMKMRKEEERFLKTARCKMQGYKKSSQEPEFRIQKKN
ncbi:MAG TPA: rRNA maturation RNase YbeY [Deltaproteobacteria bacterium]|nr:rRNA maturation RNase YbeY [Deltaproteobacteria bacterium]